MASPRAGRLFGASSAWTRQQVSPCHIWRSALVVSRSTSHRRAFAISARSQFPGIVVPLPGVLLTKELFSVDRLRDALSHDGTSPDVAVDSELGEAAVFNAQSLNEVAEIVVDRLDTHHGSGSQALLIGHSYGGYAALELARRFPDRVAGLVLVSTQCRADTAGATARRKAQVDLAKRVGVKKLLGSLRPMLLSPRSLKESSTVTAMQQMVEGTDLAVFERQMHSCAARPDQREALAALSGRIPVLVVAGSKDKLIPPRCASELREILEERSRTSAVAPWRLDVLDSGHLVPLEQPNELYSAIAAWSGAVRESARSNEF